MPSHRPPSRPGRSRRRDPTSRTVGRGVASGGFTLIEVLIVVAIIGILAAIAYPSYGDYVRKTRRSDAHVALLEQRQAFERCRALRYTYSNCTLSRTTSPENFYTLSLSPTPTATTFTIVATATGAQASDDDCSKLTIDQRDQTLAYDGNDASSADCW